MVQKGRNIYANTNKHGILSAPAVSSFLHALYICHYMLHIGYGARQQCNITYMLRKGTAVLGMEETGY